MKINVMYNYSMDFYNYAAQNARSPLTNEKICPVLSESVFKTRGYKLSEQNFIIHFIFVSLSNYGK